MLIVPEVDTIRKPLLKQLENYKEGEKDVAYSLTCPQKASSPDTKTSF